MDVETVLHVSSGCFLPAVGMPKASVVLASRTLAFFQWGHTPDTGVNILEVAQALPPRPCCGLGPRSRVPEFAAEPLPSASSVPGSWAGSVRVPNSCSSAVPLRMMLWIRPQASC